MEPGPGASVPQQGVLVSVQLVSERPVEVLWEPQLAAWERVSAGGLARHTSALDTHRVAARLVLGLR